MFIGQGIVAEDAAGRMLGVLVVILGCFDVGGELTVGAELADAFALALDMLVGLDRGMVLVGELSASEGTGSVEVDIGRSVLVSSLSGSSESGSSSSSSGSSESSAFCAALGEANSEVELS